MKIKNNSISQKGKKLLFEKWHDTILSRGEHT